MSGNGTNASIEEKPADRRAFHVSQDRARSCARAILLAVDPDRDLAGAAEGFRHELPYPRLLLAEAMSIAMGYGAIGKALQSSKLCGFLDLKLTIGHVVEADVTSATALISRVP